MANLKKSTSQSTFKIGSSADLKKCKTAVKSFFSKEEDAKTELDDLQGQIARLQERLYAQKEWAVLIVLQGMDTAGKDGLIERVLKDVNPQGSNVTSFKKPSDTEMAQDFLWRTHHAVPPKGQIGVFNRSYYEDVIAPFVHPQIIEESLLPKKLKKSKELLKNRCLDIVNFEQYLLRQGILVIKLFLHISKGEQQKRLIARIDNPDKNWKFEDADIKERSYWSKYQKAYDFCLTHTNHEQAPWHIIPSDDKLTSRLIASQIVVDCLQKIDLEFPKVDSKRKATLKKYKSQLKKS